MRVLDLFSGIGAFSLGLERAGMRTVGFCETDEFCQKVLAKHWPDIPCHDDVTTMQFEKGQADVICGGFPCQDVSLAGRRAGVSGERSGLYRELVRAIRVVRPKHAIMENVAALLSDGLGTVLGDLAESGVDAEWDCVPARAIGAPHERDRVWIVTHTSMSEWGTNSSSCGRMEGEISLPQGEEGPGGFEICTNDVWPSPNASDTDRAEARLSANSHGFDDDRSGHSASDVFGQQSEAAELRRGCCDSSGVSPDAARIRCGQGRTRRPPDSFARVRDEARWNAADPHGARLAFREGFTRNAWEKLTPAERDAFGNEQQSVWPSEPALLGVHDGTADGLDGSRKRPAKSATSAQRAHRVKALGNALVPQIPELIGRAIMDVERTFSREAAPCAAE